MHIFLTPQKCHICGRAVGNINRGIASCQAVSQDIGLQSKSQETTARFKSSSPWMAFASIESLLHFVKVAVAASRGIHIMQWCRHNKLLALASKMREACLSSCKHMVLPGVAERNGRVQNALTCVHSIDEPGDVLVQADHKIVREVIGRKQMG